MIEGNPTDIAAFRTIVAEARQQILYAGKPTLDTLRRGAEAFAQSPLARPVAATTTIQPLEGCAVPGLKVEAAGATSSLRILYLHGGAYISGSARASLGIADSLSSLFRAPVFSLDYRLAPEHPFPAGLNDVVAACRWLGAGPTLIVGDSAGGTLAIAAALSGAGPTALIAASPVLDMTDAGAHKAAAIGEDLVDPAIAAPLYAQYLRGASAESPFVSPVYAELAHLPPTLLISGGNEWLSRDCERFRAAAQKQGRQVDLEIFAGMPHDFIKFRNGVADLAFQRMAEWARRIEGLAP